MTFIDPTLGDDRSSGADWRHPRQSPPPVTPGAVWRFARGSVLEMPEPWEFRHEIRLGAYSRPGENSQPAPVLVGSPAWQYVVTARDVAIEIDSVELRGGFGAVVRLLARKALIEGAAIRHARLAATGGQAVYCVAEGEGCIRHVDVSHNDCWTDLAHVPGPSGGMIHFGNGVCDSTADDNLLADHGHTGIQFFPTDPDGASCHHNTSRRCRVTGWNSLHLRAFAMGGEVNCYANRVEDIVGEGLTAYSKVNGVHNTAINPMLPDSGIKCVAKQSVACEGVLIDGGEIAELVIGARQGRRTSGVVACGVTIGRFSKFAVDGGTVGAYLLDDCDVKEMV